MTTVLRVLRTGNHNFVRVVATAMFVTFVNFSASAQIPTGQYMTHNRALGADSENHMTWCSDSISNRNQSYVYDLFERRLTYPYVYSGVTCTPDYLWDGENPLEGVDQTGALAPRPTDGRGSDEPLAMFSPGTTRFFEADGRGTYTSLTNSGGAAKDTTAYVTNGRGDPAHNGPTHHPELSAGREYDTTGPYSFRARYRDPIAVSSLGEGPTRFDETIQFHDYTENNPLNRSDRQGPDSVSVCCRPIHQFFPLSVFRHCYVQIHENADGMDHTWGVLGDVGGTNHQKMRKDDLAILDDKGNVKDPRNSRGQCSTVDGSDLQIQKLEEGLEAAVNSQTCPSCGKNYRLWFARDLVHLFDGHNSNTWIYNMILGAGMKPPHEGNAPGYHWAAGAWYPVYP